MHQQVRTDLAMEARAASQATGQLNGVVVVEEQIDEITRSVVTITDERGATALGRPCGVYITLSCAQCAQPDPTIRQAMSQLLARALTEMVPKEGDVLVVGLGNRRVTPDALGPRVVDDTLVTRHLRGSMPAALNGRLRPVSAVAPGVLGVTGMETAEMIRGIIQHVKPAAVIAVDALAARDSGRICSTIQITNTGICPGSGVGNHRLGLTQETLGVPVVAVGVPMVVYASTIARDALQLLVHDLIPDEQSHQDALDEMVGRVVSHKLGDMVVTPREVDSLVSHMAGILATGINLALQPGLDQNEIPILMQ